MWQGALVLLLLWVQQHHCQHQECTALSREPGVCTDVNVCRPLRPVIDFIKDNTKPVSRRAAAVNFLRRSRCPSRGSQRRKVRHQFNRTCTTTIQADKVVGGKPANVGSWPWAALLVYDDKLAIRCGGLLIADGWILTAAHCVKNGISPPGSQRRKVRHQFNRTCTTTIQADKVVGGKPANVGSWPWAALLVYDDQLAIRCGGLLIADGWILTAAHCVKNGIRPNLVRLGDHDLFRTDDIEHRTYPVLRIIPHEDYGKPLRGDNDIALIEINQSQGYPGGQFSDVLQQVQLTVVPTDDCAAIFKRGNFGDVVDEHKLCAYEEGKDTCGGDSGGGLFLPRPTTPGEPLKYYVIGIVAFGFRCAEVGFPGVYTRVTDYLDWINARID
ncbi:unnamed protein product [Cyprideis torosa]|uniref:CLIP domain-containing serine protease n=1 Tax=Cyprideis torosa TaxID=163714 RepID=A0A7R8ZIF7_9CRUS|nr:unnamed protein product [Cyprideis torosa]CAG0886008.1 unnamed protein product [Cyprideis torosa]